MACRVCLTEKRETQVTTGACRWKRGHLHRSGLVVRSSRLCRCVVRRRRRRRRRSRVRNGWVLRSAPAVAVERSLKQALAMDWPGTVSANDVDL